MIATIAGAAIALGSAIYSGVKSAQQNKKARKLIEKQRAENKDWYNTRMAEDYTLRSDVQAAIKKQRELLDEQYRRAKATGVVSGASEEAIALQKQAANQSLADATTDIAAQASAHKDSIEAAYRAQDAALNQQQVVGYQQSAANTAQAGSQAVNAGTSLMGNDIYMDGLKKAKSEPTTIK